MLIKKEVIDKIGFLDENYFLYMEDTDYCQRTIDAGFKIYYSGSSRIYHKVFSSTAKETSLLPVYYSIRNRLYFAHNNLGSYYYIVLIYLIFVFTVKMFIPKREFRKFAKIVFSSFRDFFGKRMGKTEIF